VVVPFIDYDEFFVVGFALVTLALSIISLVVYRLMKTRQLRVFGLAFFLISLAYFAKAYLESTLTSEELDNKIFVEHITTLTGHIAIYAYLFLFLAGLVLLVYLPSKIEALELHWLLMLILFIPLILDPHKLLLFYIFSSVLLFFIFIFYVRNYFRNRSRSAFLVVFAFLLLFLGMLSYLFSEMFYSFYILGHFFDLVAYFTILVNLVSILTRAQ
jgi:hypothetical protein